ncbi:hypothetical protein [Brevibacterium sp. VCM10]|uniref:hypothetical protein n=1 Tax=Brevibacterium sp. VCM10 TaxID=1381751 RepID=UPI0004AF65F7|nr:hypothetical protein [Brevibacterium sp. VCM10]
MTAHAFEPARYDTQTAQDLEWSQINVEGLSPSDVESALELYREIIKEQLHERESLIARLTQAYLSKTVQLIPEATQRQAQRSVSFRARLLEEEGAETYESLAILRGSSQSTTRAWVARHRDKFAMFTLEAEGRTLIPKVQLTDRGMLRKNVAALIKPLAEAELGGWGLWSWLTAPTSLLSDEIPAVVAESSPERARTAAELYAEDLRDAKDRMG